MAAKTYLERTAETIVEFAAAHQKALREMADRFDASIAKVNETLDELAIQNVQLNQGLKQQAKNIEKLTEAIDRQSQSFEKQLDRVITAIDRQAETIDRQSQSFEKKFDQVMANLDRQSTIMESYLRMAEQNGRTAERQAETVAELTKLVVMQASGRAGAA